MVDNRLERPWLRQREATVRCEWGPAALTEVAADIVVVIDVLRFTTAVDVAVGHGLLVRPFRWALDEAASFADREGAALADGGPGRPSLSPSSLLALRPGTAVVLPSPNGSTCAALAAERGATVVAACLRNATAVGRWVDERLADGAGSVLVVPCGERWPDGSLRPAAEDLLGAGAVIDAISLGRVRSPEAALTETAWRTRRDAVAEVLGDTVSGREQTTRGWSDDLAVACQVDSSETVPVLVDGAFVAAG